MEQFLLSPPAVFLIVFAFCNLLSWLAAKLAFKNPTKTEDAGKSYACGEDVDDHMAQPDYSQFFPFAFFFTIAHVATMIITTVPRETAPSLVMAELYIVTVVVALFILLRR